MGGGGVSFIITSSDFANGGSGYGVTPNGTLGFTEAPGHAAGEALYNANNLTAGKQTELINFWTTNSLPSSYTGIIFTASWGAGSSPGSDKVLIGFNTGYPQQLLIAPVYTGNNNWQTGGQDNYSIQGVAGTYNFPATFTLYQPLTVDNNDWC